MIPLYGRKMIQAHFCEQAASAQLTECEVNVYKRFMHVFSDLIGPTAYETLAIFTFPLKKYLNI